MVSIKKLTNLESSDSTFRRKKMAQRVGKYKLTKREQETSLTDGGVVGGNLTVQGTSSTSGIASFTAGTLNKNVTKQSGTAAEDLTSTAADLVWYASTAQAANITLPDATASFCVAFVAINI